MHVGRERLTFAAAVSLTAVLAACSSSGSSSTSASGPTGGATATAASGSITLAGVVANATDPYWITVMCGGTAEAKKLGVSLKWYPSTTPSAQSMAQNFDAALLTKPQGMYINPFSAGQFSTQVKSLMSKGTPVIASAALSPASEYTDTFINTAGGQFVHQFLQQLTPGPGSLVVLGGIAGIPVVEDEYTPLLAAVKSARPDIKILPIQYDQFNVTTATQIISSLLLSHPDLKMIIAPAGPEGEGAAAAIEQAHKVGTVKIWAYDATPAEVQALRAGVISVLLAKPAAEVGAEAVQWLVSAIKADPNHAAIAAGSGLKTALPVVEITKANVNDPAIQGDLYKGTCSS
ncbi:MAG TPA: substrate-binding domain-containing protein [Streptosporangiaceae bacterium]|jgi:ribose transport system substrate-binding protein|nr:substrate-binding domain-containing protein [Streptosporangiaceae bacterium]